MNYEEKYKQLVKSIETYKKEFSNLDIRASIAQQNFSLGKVMMLDEILYVIDELEQK